VGSHADSPSHLRLPNYALKDQATYLWPSRVTFKRSFRPMCDLPRDRNCRKGRWHPRSKVESKPPVYVKAQVASIDHVVGSAFRRKGYSESCSQHLRPKHGHEASSRSNVWLIAATMRWSPTSDWMCLANKDAEACLNLGSTSGCTEPPPSVSVWPRRVLGH